jgi:hypothetical protein
MFDCIITVHVQGPQSAVPIPLPPLFSIPSYALYIYAFSLLTQRTSMIFEPCSFETQTSTYTDYYKMTPPGLSTAYVTTVSLRCMYGNHRQPTQAIFSQCCSTPSHEATKSRERPVTYIQESTDNVRSSFKSDDFRTCTVMIQSNI